MGIVFGGSGVESDVSIISALQLKKSINIKKYEVILIYISKENKFFVDKSLSKLDSYKEKNFKDEVYFKKGKNNKVYLISKLNKKEIDVVIPVVHGVGYEDGTLSGYFKFLDLPVVMAHPTILGIMQNKKITKDLLKFNGINVCNGILISEYDYYNNRDEVISKINKLSYPLIIKPNSLGSSVGIKIVKEPTKLRDNLLYSFNYESNLLIEEAFTDFREFNMAVMGKNIYQASAIEEVISKGDFYSYENKYINDTKKILNPSLSDDIKEEIKALSLKISKIFDLNGLIRVDYLYDNINKKLYVNEVNGIPGSYSYYLFEKEGLLFTEVIDKLIDMSIKERYERLKKKQEFKSNIFEKEFKEK